MLRTAARDIVARVAACRLLARPPGLDASSEQWGRSGIQYALYGSTVATEELRVRDHSNEVSSQRPQSLAHTRATDRPNQVTQQSIWAKALLSLGGFNSKESKLLRAAKCLYEGVVEQATDTRLQKAVNLQDRFAHRHALLCIHMWLLLVRLRAEGDDGKDLAQMVYENFQEDVEKMVRAEGVTVRLSKYLKDLEQMFYGSCLAYEKGLAGELDLTAGLLRNVYGDEAAHKADATILARYIRRELACLSMTNSDAVMAGQIKFSQLSGAKAGLI